MAASNQVISTTLKSVSSDTPPSRWTSVGSNSNGPSHSARGRSGRVRTGGRNGKSHQNAHGGQTPKPNDGSSDSPTTEKPTQRSFPVRPTLSVTAPSNPSSTTSPKNSSRRPSRANSTFSTSHSSPVIESPISPTSSRSSNRRKRSGAGRGNSVPKINLPAPQDNFLRTGRPRNGSTPHTAPLKDTPPYPIPKQPRTPVGSFDLSKDIDALVERVRAVAMAENRPSTPGSHIDWAGEDDDSLPDLDDWGITSLSTPDPKTSVISPIIIGGLKPLPELTPSVVDATVKPQDGTTSIHVLPCPSPQSAKNPENSTNATSASKPVLAKPVLEEITEQVRPSEANETGKATIPSDEVHDSDASGDPDLPGSEGLAQSIHAPPMVCVELGREGLAASIHAPRAIVDSSSAPAQLNVPHSRQGHGRAHTVGRPFPRPNLDDGSKNRSARNGRGGFHGSPKQHMRNHSSPAATTHRSSHSRPVLTGDAISRLAKVVGSTTAPPSKPTPVTND